jgi:NitT/TauT family transport system substrate-binding protein
MKSRIIYTVILLSVLLLSACVGVTTSTPVQEPSVTSTELPAGETATPEPVNYEEVTLTINSSSVISFAPIFIAETEGYFTEYGIKMNYVTFNSVSEATPLVITGDLDVLAGAVNVGLLNIIGKEDNIKVVADRGHIAPGDSCTFQGILVRKDLYESGEITSAADLAGQTIDSSKAGINGYLLSTYLAQAGLTFDDVNLNEIPTTGYLDAFANKSLAAIVTTESNVTRLLTSGNAVLLAKAEEVIGTAQPSALVFGKNLLVDHPDVGARFMAAYLKGVQQYNEGKTERNLQILSDATGDSTDALQAVCWVPIRTDGSIVFSGIEGFQQWSIAQGLLEAPVTEEQFWDPSFIAAAQALLHP